MSAAMKLADITSSREPNLSEDVLFSGRESNELVIGFCGAIGSGISTVVQSLTEVLKAARYEIVPVKVSTQIKSAVKAGLASVEIDESSKDRYYETLQTAGNELRKAKKADILARLAIREIAKHRTKRAGADIDLEAYEPTRTAYLVDQLKHPDEVALLRAVYGNLFYLIGTLSLQEVRKTRLTEEGLTAAQAENAMERDRKEPNKFGQQLERTLHLADFFLRNNHVNEQVLRGSLKRFVDLLHGANGLTPTHAEYGMYIAFAAGMKSACLSRQVGASIQDREGRIIATGCNDVPKYGGGLYTADDGSDDKRCVHFGQYCRNDKHKKNLVSQIRRLLEKYSHDETSSRRLISAETIGAISDDIYESTRIKDLIEFSRAVHAEMDALLSLARGGNGSTIGASLYSTTFPCHNCARHIVAAGIQTVYYIEPYEKSMARTLHEDAITLDATDTNKSEGRVNFVQFEGVAPRLYKHAFKHSRQRKDTNGRAIRNDVSTSSKVSAEYLDNYRQIETKIVSELAGLEGRNQ